MSIHLVDRAAQLPIPGTTKLVLMAFADSADDYTHVAFPGLDKVQTWASVGRSRAAELVAELTDLGLLRKHRGGHRGRRAEYVVFPNGCCAEHPRGPVNEASASSDPFTLKGSTAPDPNDAEEKGSGRPESMSVKGSDAPDPNPADQKGSAVADASRGKGPERVRRTGPLPQRKTNSPHPPASGGHDDDSPTTLACPRHGGTPGPNCRICRTTPRQIEKRRKAQAEMERRATEQRRLEAARAERERIRARGRSPDVDQLLADTRNQLARSNR